MLKILHFMLKIVECLDCVTIEQKFVADKRTVQSVNTNQIRNGCAAVTSSHSRRKKEPKMYIFSNLIKVTIPNYLASLPIPDSIGGWFHLGVKDWLALIPPTAVVGGISYYSYQTIKKAREAGNGQINPIIRKDVNKVVDFIDIEDITEKASLCRCWRSKNWPYCDGSHGAHNKETGDNTGPVVVKHKEKK